MRALGGASLERIGQLSIFVLFKLSQTSWFRPHNGSIRAFLTRWLGERKAECSLSPLYVFPLSLSLICSLYFFFRRVVLEDHAVVSKSSSQLLSPHPTHSIDTRAQESISPSLSDPCLNPCITQQAITIQ